MPQEYLDKFAFIDYPNRQHYAAMVHYIDDTIGALVDSLKKEHLWDNTILIFFSDNGGPVYFPGSGNNHPLRGGKYSDFEGGIHVLYFSYLENALTYIYISTHTNASLYKYTHIYT